MISKLNFSTKCHSNYMTMSVAVTQRGTIITDYNFYILKQQKLESISQVLFIQSLLVASGTLAFQLPMNQEYHHFRLRSRVRIRKVRELRSFESNHKKRTQNLQFHACIQIFGIVNKSHVRIEIPLGFRIPGEGEWSFNSASFTSADVELGHFRLMFAFIRIT